jgi:hypothetical protein
VTSGAELIGCRRVGSGSLELNDPKQCPHSPIYTRQQDKPSKLWNGASELQNEVTGHGANEPGRTFIDHNVMEIPNPS